jgi:hypothetical protein
MTRGQELTYSSRPTLRTKGKQTALLVVVVSLLLASAAEPAVAQEWLVRFDGRVQWIAGQLMVVQPALGSSVSVDLVSVPQDEYAGLAAQYATGNVWSICPGLVRPKSRGYLRLKSANPRDPVEIKPICLATRATLPRCARGWKSAATLATHTP